ncbi:hypothetical protein LOZ33_006180 [Ophidiomyces ophidiicola]|uniref:Uncharacterized protein n=1 Tax=Ophidiomyces ophidiicola TaxID=1387563 RepID=A0ACB8UMU0_9EURO|nr:hypothetical protein LOZ50_006497 [Ophidiomyces ophidiicola]KAI2003960.1 hypothetical protein LOZ49_006062 [Ophidiomyces ophidiicola]KAI2026938.1 hypothetical protein LOZ46_000017 [Ophidiomyces ophidiicola]KAI2089084.1 hypothetical protein LOZ33_006180 [Ophidiomyces ophidiicola]KAI2134064.1 hypothetical protein LOZ29_004437 [Ophidiomyces ophidiicola]
MDSYRGVVRRAAVARSRPAPSCEASSSRIKENVSPSQAEYPAEEYHPFYFESPAQGRSSKNTGAERLFQSYEDTRIPFRDTVNSTRAFDHPRLDFYQGNPRAQLGHLYFPEDHFAPVGHEVFDSSEKGKAPLRGSAATSRQAPYHLEHEVSRPPQFPVKLGAQFDEEDGFPRQSDPAPYHYSPSRYSESGSVAAGHFESRSWENSFPKDLPQQASSYPQPKRGCTPKGPSTPVAPKKQTTGFPQPHQFNTLSNRAQFDPLNFFPSVAKPHGSLELPSCAPIVRRVTEPVVKGAPDTPQIIVEPPTGSKRVATEPSVATSKETSRKEAQNLSTPFDDPVSQTPTPKSRKKSIHRLAESFKHLFNSRSKTDSDVSFKHSRTKSSSKKRRPSLSSRLFRRPSQQTLINYDLVTQSKVPPLPKMDHSRFLDPSSAMMALTKQKSEAMRLAREQSAAVVEMCRRAKTDVPQYSFEELIGKGSYGRVYKGRQLSSQKFVAIKVMDIDKLDYQAIRDMRDESIKDFIHETKVLQQVKDAGAKNINMFIEAVSIHSQLWLICEYCPGGSVKTLMRATGDKLEEKFIIPIARELAEGLKAIHDAGIIHRDVKETKDEKHLSQSSTLIITGVVKVDVDLDYLYWGAANILIHEEGRLQICDFGVAGVLQTKLDKRSTWIGTPHWMPPEMFPSRVAEPHQYGSEVDVWAYGCTLFECATGNPPNATLRERMQIGRQLNRFAPKLEGDAYSDRLRSLVSYSLAPDPRTRPTMKEILKHEYIMDSSEAYPTNILSELVRIYYQWSQRGGQRVSLFNPGGAAAAEMPLPMGTLGNEEWNFSTTAGFEKRYSIIDLDELSASLAALDEDLTPTGAPRTMGQGAEMTFMEKANFDERVKRGAAAMEGLFDEAKPDYKYETKNDFVPMQQMQRRSSDLPLRTDTDRSSVTSTFIDINLGDYESSHYAAGSASNNPPFQLADPDTIRANRSSARLIRNSSSSSTTSQEFQPRGPRPPTMDWTFDTAGQMTDEPDIMTQDDLHEEPPPEEETFKSDKRETMAWTFPVMTTNEGAPGDEALAEDGPGESEEEDPNRTEPGYTWRPDLDGTVRAADRPFSTLQPPPFENGPTSQIDAQPESRPTTALSMRSETDQDPFRFDGTTTVPNPNTPPEERPDPTDQFPAMPPSSLYEDFDASTLASSFNEYQDTNWSQGVTLRNGSSTEPRRQSVVSSLYAADVNKGQPVPEVDKPSSLYFPEPMPPSSECLADGASEDMVSAELDRLLGDFVQGLASTREALAATDN